MDGQGRDTDGQQAAELAGRGCPGSDQAALAWRGTFEQVGDHHVIFAPDRKPHRTTQEKEKPARDRTCLGVGWRQGGGQHCHCHDGHGQQQGAAAPKPVSDMTEDDGSQRSQQIGECKSGQCHQQRGLSAAKKHP